MSRTILDANMLTWEVYPSGSAHGYAENPQIIFNCLSNRMLRPRYLRLDGEDEADAERKISLASNEELTEMFLRSQEVS